MKKPANPPSRRKAGRRAYSSPVGRPITRAAPRANRPRTPSPAQPPRANRPRTAPRAAARAPPPAHRSPRKPRQLMQSHGIIYPAILYDDLYPANIPDMMQRIAIDDKEIGRSPGH